jgi:signal transduction histidine kinase
MRLRFITKLSLSFLLVTLISLFSIGLISYLNGKKALQNATFSELRLSSTEKQAALETWISERLNGISRLAADKFLTERVNSFMSTRNDSQENDKLHSDLVNNLSGYLWPAGNYSEIFILDPKTGQILISTSPNEEGKYRENLPYFIEGKNNPFVQEVYYSAEKQSTAMTAAAPIISKIKSINEGEVNQLIAVIAGRLNLEEMDTIIQRRSGLHTSDDSFLISANHLLVTKPLFLPDSTVLQTGLYTNAINSCLKGTSGELLDIDYRGIPAIINYQWMKSHNLCLIVKLNQDEAFAPAISLGQSIIIIAIFILFFVSLIIIWLSRNFSRPVVLLLQGTEEVGKGNLNHRIYLSSGDEFETLSIAFNKMAESLFDKDMEIQNWGKALEQKVDERTKELLRSNSDLERFAYVASHDLQEPLRMVTSYLQLLERRYKDRLDGDALEFIEYAVDGAERMKTLIIDLLAYSRIGTRGKAFILTDCNIVLIRVLTFLKAAIDETNAKILYDSLPEILADETQMEQLFQNLIANAIKFHGKESPRIHIGVDRKGEDWVFSIQDHGIGIDPKYFDRVFIIFQRLHTRQDYPGTGIGLAICKRIIERHGGRIWIESELEKGSTFFFTIPIKGANDDQ